MISCSVVIRCCNEEQHIGRLLAGIAEQTLRDTEVIVVDSGSTDATLSIASRFATDIVHIEPGRFSFGRSLNLGCRRAHGDFLVIASAHVYPLYRDWLERLVAPFADGDVALVYGKQRGDERTAFSEHQVFRRWFPEVSDPGQGHPFCNNANAAVRRTLWQEQPYDEALTGLEDLDWARKVMARGHRVAYAAEATVVHVHSETSAQTYNRYRREGIALKRIFPEREFGVRQLFSLTGRNVVADWAEAARRGLLSEHAVDIPRFRLMQFWGTFRGYRQSGQVTDALRDRFYYPDRDTAAATRDGDAGREGLRIDYAGTETGEREDA
jgi:rhamnosyltransferase